MNRPITIAGGGLAGLSIAIGLRNNGYPVEVLESGRYPRHRVCGEFLAGLSPELLKGLGIDDCFSDCEQHHTVTWFHCGRQVRTFQLPGSALGISRYSLDLRLANRLRSMGSTIHENATVGKAERPGLVRATGRKPGKGRMIGLKGHWRDLQTVSGLEMHLGRGTYLGISAVESGYVNVCGLFSRLAEGRFPTPLDRFYATLRMHGLDYLARRLEQASLRPGSLCSVTGLDYQSQAATSCPALGDQLGMIPPFTGNGMTLAMESAHIVLPFLCQYADGKIGWDRYLEQSRRALMRRFRHRVRTARLIHPMLLNPSGQALTVFLARFHLLPFTALYRLTH